MPREAFSAKGAATVGPYSHAIQSGDVCYLSGQTPLSAVTGNLIEGDVAAQTEQCLKNLFNVMEIADLKPGDVIKVNVYMTDMSNFSTMNEVYSRYFDAPYPARTTIGVAALPLGAQIEMEMIARKG